MPHRGRLYRFYKYRTRLGMDDSDERTSLPKVPPLKFNSIGRGKKVIGDKEATQYFFSRCYKTFSFVADDKAK
jgi:hypothetical protein